MSTSNSGSATTFRFMPKKVPPSSAFGERLMRLRMARGLTQTQLAELIDSSQRAVSRYETIAELPPTAVLIKLAKALDVSTDVLLGLKTPRKVAEPKEDPEMRRLWKRFQLVRSLPDKDQRAVIRLINSLVSVKESRRTSAA
ncbi:MAG: helix-turn-helix transcriptional regulator [Myxococcales bacterium]|nr:helix-turn-helix transcriptional regulator [Myxococcales bacterium]